MNQVAYLDHAAIDRRFRINRNRITAEVIACSGQLSDDTYHAVQSNIEELTVNLSSSRTLSVFACPARTRTPDPTAVGRCLPDRVRWR